MLAALISCLIITLNQIMWPKENISVDLTNVFTTFSSLFDFTGTCLWYNWALAALINPVRSEDISFVLIDWSLLWHTLSPVGLYTRVPVQVQSTTFTTAGAICRNSSEVISVDGIHLSSILDQHSGVMYKKCSSNRAGKCVYKYNYYTILLIGGADFFTLFMTSSSVLNI